MFTVTAIFPSARASVVTVTVATAAQRDRAEAHLVRLGYALI